MVRRVTLFFFRKTDVDGKEPVCSQNQIKAREAQKLVNFSVMSAILIKKLLPLPTNLASLVLLLGVRKIYDYHT